MNKTEALRIAEEIVEASDHIKKDDVLSFLIAEREISQDEDLGFAQLRYVSTQTSVDPFTDFEEE